MTANTKTTRDINDFIASLDYGNCSMIDSELGQTILDDISVAKFEQMVYLQSPLNFSEVDGLSDVDHNVQCFRKNQPAIKSWFESINKVEGSYSTPEQIEKERLYGVDIESDIVGFVTDRVAVLTDSWIKRADVKSIVFDGDFDNEAFIVIADSITKITNLSLLALFCVYRKTNISNYQEATTSH